MAPKQGCATTNCTDTPLDRQLSSNRANCDGALKHCHSSKRHFQDHKSQAAITYFQSAVAERQINAVKMDKIGPGLFSEVA